MVTLKNVVKKLYIDYKNVYLKLEDENPELEVCSCIEDDLLDKGFSNQEINEIISENLTTNTLYKLGAYMIALFNQPETLEEWRTSIKNDVMVDLLEEDVVTLWNAYQTIDF